MWIIGIAINGNYVCKLYGYCLLKFPIVSLDIMECKDGLHNCSQICIEQEGEFSCDCYYGYELLEDGVSCKGT